MRKFKILLGKEKEGVDDAASILQIENYSNFDVYDALGDTLEDTYKFDRESVNYYVKRIFEIMTDADLRAYLKRIERYLPARGMVITSDVRLAKFMREAFSGDLIRVAMYNADSTIPLEDPDYDLTLNRGVSVNMIA